MTDIKAIVEGISYEPLLKCSLKRINIEDFNVNTAPGSCVIRDGDNEFGLSKWISPKRTRSYPYARVYDTVSKLKRVTVIPIIKDEGLDGDRDFIQWDTISLMSLLEVYVIFGYYDKAIRNFRYQNKITKQEFNNQAITEKLKEFSSYQSSALHWNLKELRETLPSLVEQQKSAYSGIVQKTGVQLKSLKGIDSFRDELQNNLNLFMESSRRRAEQAQNREIQTVHAGEYLETTTKASITVTNYLGGKYFFTVDELIIQDDIISLIESKNSDRTTLPSKNDIKDGLLKMILYSNLSSVYSNDRALPHQAILKLTSSFLKENISSKSSSLKVSEFYALNRLKLSSQSFINQLFDEANHNQFEVIISSRI